MYSMGFGQTTGLLVTVYKEYNLPHFFACHGFVMHHKFMNIKHQNLD